MDLLQNGINGATEMLWVGKVISGYGAARLNDVMGNENALASFTLTPIW